MNGTVSSDLLSTSNVPDGRSHRGVAENDQ